MELHQRPGLAAGQLDKWLPSGTSRPAARCGATGRNSMGVANLEAAPVIPPRSLKTRMARHSVMQIQTASCAGATPALARTACSATSRPPARLCSTGLSAASVKWAMPSAIMPGKSIDFFSERSGDSALLDVFCISESPDDAIVANRVSLNSASDGVLKAMLSEGLRRDAGGSNLTSSQRGSAQRERGQHRDPSHPQCPQFRALPQPQRTGFTRDERTAGEAVTSFTIKRQREALPSARWLTWWKPTTGTS
jgi:hypothetical protein